MKLQLIKNYKYSLTTLYNLKKMNIQLIKLKKTKLEIKEDLYIKINPNKNRIIYINYLKLINQLGQIPF
jgi:hypothetical protein